MKKLLQRLNAWRMTHIGLTAREDRDKERRTVNFWHGEITRIQQEVRERESAVLRREMDCVRAEVERRLGDTTTFTLTVSDYMLRHRVNRNLDTEICKSICRKIIDGLVWSSQQKVGNYSRKS